MSFLIRAVLTAFVLALAAFGAVALVALSTGQREPSGTGQLPYGVSVREWRLKDGTRCVIIEQTRGVGISCEWIVKGAGQ